MTPPRPDAPIDQLMNVSPAGAGRWRAHFPEGWHQGRGLFGGLVLGTMVRAIEAELNEPQRQLRSLTAQLCAPTQAGLADLHVEVLRKGSAVTTVACRLIQGGELMAHAVGVLGRTRTTERDLLHLPAPHTPPPWRELEPLPFEPPLAPEFATQWEFRVDPTVLPFSGNTTDPIAEGWIRPRHPGATRDAAYVVCNADAWWPGSFMREELPRPMATIAFTLELCDHPELLDLAKPLFHRARDPVIRDGYVVEFRELWDEHGRLFALNQQTLCIIK